MLTKKKKLSKKEIKQDKLVTYYYKAYGYFEENKTKILYYIVGLVAVIALSVFYIYHHNQQNNEAGLELSRVIPSFDSGSYLEAIEGRAGSQNLGLKKIVSDFGSTENGNIAKIYLADSYSLLGNYDEAFKYYKDYSGSIDMYKATAFAGQGGFYASKGDFEKAAEYYAKASRVSRSDVLNPGYLLQAGINYLKAGKNSDAKDELTAIGKDYVSSPEYREANQYLAQLE